MIRQPQDRDSPTISLIIMYVAERKLMCLATSVIRRRDDGNLVSGLYCLDTNTTLVVVVVVSFVSHPFSIRSCS